MLWTCSYLALGWNDGKSLKVCFLKLLFASTKLKIHFKNFHYSRLDFSKIVQRIKGSCISLGVFILQRDTGRSASDPCETWDAIESLLICAYVSPRLLCCIAVTLGTVNSKRNFGFLFEFTIWMFEFCLNERYESLEK